MMTPFAPTIWNRLHKEAETAFQNEPFAASFLQDLILSRSNYEESLIAVLSVRLADEMMPRHDLETLFRTVILSHHQIIEHSVLDLQAVIDRDPACNSLIEPLLFFKGFQALQAHRIGHALWNTQRRFAALLLQSLMSRAFGVDIHPAAQIGHGILLDHATNFVVGETAIIGNDVSILHGVSLGGNGKEKGDRHPKIGDDVMIGAHAQLLGNIHIGKGAKIGAGAVVLANVPAHTTVAGVPAVRVGRTCESQPALAMNQDFTLDSAG